MYFQHDQYTQVQGSSVSKTAALQSNGCEFVNIGGFSMVRILCSMDSYHRSTNNGGPNQWIITPSVQIHLSLLVTV